MKSLLLLLFTFLIFACKKGKGAICNDGWRSHSTGQGTCSWHGGIDHYIDPEEIDITDTIGLVAILAFIGYVVIINILRGSK